MVTGFEEFSHELTDIEESKIYPKFIEAWNIKPYEQFVTMKEMLEGMQNWIEKQNILTKKGKLYKITGPRMRKIIHKARVSGKLYDMIANSKGYFKTQDVEKIRKFIQSCRERANSFTEVADATEAYLSRKGSYKEIPLYTELSINDTTYNVLQSPAGIQRALQSSTDGEIKLNDLEGRSLSIKINPGDSIKTTVIDKRV